MDHLDCTEVELKSVMEDIAHLNPNPGDALNEPIATRDDIDTAITTGVNYPKGLLKWADDIGLNTPLAQLKDLHTQSGDDRYIASPLLEKMAVSNSTFYA